jgi:MFS family permease
MLNTHRTSAAVAVRRLATARLISLAGTDASAVALGFALYERTASPAWLSLALLGTIGLGSVLSPLGGWAADAFDRKRLMVGAELTAAALLVFMVASDGAPGWLLGLSVAVVVVGAPFGPASTAALPSLAGPDGLARANAWVSTGSNLGKTGGRLASGGLLALAGADAVFLADALTFVVSALLVASVHGPFREAAPESPGSEARGFMPGFRLLLSDRMMRPVAAAACGSTFLTAFSLTAEVPLVFEIGGGAAGLGALTAAWGLGMIAGSWAAGRCLHRGNEVTGALAGRLAMGTGIALVGLCPVLGAAACAYVVGGAGGGLMGVAAQSIMQRNTPDSLRGRVQGAMESARNMAFAAGALSAGALVGALGPHATYLVVGVGVLVAATPLWRLARDLGGLRALRPLPSV